MKYRTILLFGAPGSGKGTQGKIFGSIPGFFHCACGDVFRNLRIDDPLGKVFVEYSSRGLLVPDEPTINLSYAEQHQMIERLQRRALRENRLDDANLDVIKKRLDTYERDTKPVLDY